MVERQEKIINGITYIADVVPYAQTNWMMNMTGAYCGLFVGESYTLVSINHPIYGLITKNDIDKPFKVKGSPFKWKLKSIYFNQIVLEATIVCGLFTRKIIKFI